MRQANLDAMPHPIMFGDDDLGLAELRDIALGFPEAFEKISHGRPVFCAPKMFAIYGGSSKTTGEMVRFSHSVLVKVDESERVALEQDPAVLLPDVHGSDGLARPGLRPPRRSTGTRSANSSTPRTVWWHRRN